MSNCNSVFLGQREIGEIAPDGYFQQHISTRHLLVSPPAKAYADSVLEQIKASGATGLRFTVRDTQKIYEATFETFDRHCFKVQRGGFEPQHAMRLEMWDVSGGIQTGDASKALDRYYKRQGKKESQQISMGL